MNEYTFNKKAISSKKHKENCEWVIMWCENADSDRLPRVALIGDSIVRQTFERVKEELKDIAYVDYFATSYSILSPAYVGMLEKLIEDSDYEVVYYNYGLHAGDVTAEEYEEAYRNILKMFLKKSKVIIGLTTHVLDETNLDKESDVWSKIVRERNARANKLAKEFDILVDDLYTVSVQLGKEGKSEDGVHFSPLGVEKIAQSRIKAIRKLLK